MTIHRQKIHETLYYFALIGIGISIPVSNILMSFFSILLFTNWIFEGQFAAKFNDRNRNKITFCFLVPFLVFCLWILRSSQINQGLDELRRELPLCILPLVICTSKRLPLKRYQTILSLYVSCVFLASVYAYISFKGDLEMDYRRMIWFISHIRFSLNICFCIVILMIQFFFSNSPSLKYKIRIRILSTLLILWFLFFLILLHSYTGFFLISILLLTVFSHRFFKELNLSKRKVIKLVLTILLITFIGYETYIIKDYYTPKGVAVVPYKMKTIKGNLYTHAQNGFIENGNYIDDYICEKEIREAWQEKGLPSLESRTKNGSRMYSTLIRYLNSYGYTKDAEGIKKLTEKDIENVQLGIANRYASKTISLHNLTYQLLFEWDLYRKCGYYMHSSTFQRVHLWENAINVFKKSPVWGVGTGNTRMVFQKELEETNSLLKEANMPPHSQYLSFLISFGIVGFTLIFGAYCLIIFKTQIRSHFLYCSFIIIIFCSMISENTLETQAGVTLFSFFFPFLVQMRHFDKSEFPPLRTGINS